MGLVLECSHAGYRCSCHLQHQCSQMQLCCWIRAALHLLLLAPCCQRLPLCWGFSVGCCCRGHCYEPWDCSWKLQGSCLCLCGVQGMMVGGLLSILYLSPFMPQEVKGFDKRLLLQLRDINKDLNLAILQKPVNLRNPAPPQACAVHAAPPPPPPNRPHMGPPGN